MFCIELNSSCVCSNHRKHLHSICQENNDLWDGLDNAKSILNHCHILQEKHDLTDLINRPYYCEDYSGSGSEFCKIKDCCLALAFQSRAILRIQLEQYIKYTRNIFTIDKYKKHYLQLRRKIRKKYIRKENQRSDL